MEPSLITNFMFYCYFMFIIIFGLIITNYYYYYYIIIIINCNIYTLSPSAL